MAEELEGLWRHITLTADEQDLVIEDEATAAVSNTDEKLWMVGRLLTTRPFSKQAMMNTLKLVWKLAKEVTIMALEDNLFLFKYSSETDKDRVIEGSPWFFDKHLLLFSEYNGDLRPDEYSFTKALFWIRVYELPLGKRSKEMAERIGSRIGKLVAVDPTLEAGGWARFIRVRVEIDITKPLRRAVMIGGTGGSTVKGRLSTFRKRAWAFSSCSIAPPA